MFRALAAVVVALSAVLVAPGSAWAAPAASVGITGDVATPAVYTAADLAALPSRTVALAHQEPGAAGTLTGVDVAGLVTRSAPVLTAPKNPQLRVLLTVTGRGHRAVTLAFGELDSGFGNHPAVLTTAGSRIRLVVPGDRTAARDVVDVATIRVTVSAATAADVPAGAVVVTGPYRSVTLSAATLARLPAQSRTVTFLAGAASQTHTETGPPLALVVAVAGVLPTPDTAVVAVGSDGYGAAVTLGEAYFGGRPLLLSTVEDGVALVQPRLVPDGDVKGGRYVSGTVRLQAG